MTKWGTLLAIRQRLPGGRAPRLPKPRDTIGRRASIDFPNTRRGSGDGPLQVSPRWTPQSALASGFSETVNQNWTRVYY